MTVLHNILLLLLLAGGVFVEIQLARFLATLRRVKEVESDHLLNPVSVDPTPSEIFEVLYGASDSRADRRSP